MLVLGGVKPVIALFIALVAGSAQAAPVHDTVRSLERGVAFAGKSKGPGSVYLRGRKLGIELRAHGGESGVIAVHHTWSSHGYFLGGDGKLSPTDREALRTELATDPGLSRGAVVRGVRSAIVLHRVESARLSTADEMIDTYLTRSKLAPGGAMLVSQGRHGTVELVVRPEGTGMFRVAKGFSQRAMLLDGNATTGFSMSPADRADLARIMLAN